MTIKEKVEFHIKCKKEKIEEGQFDKHPELKDAAIAHIEAWEAWHYKAWSTDWINRFPGFIKVFLFAFYCFHCWMVEPEIELLHQRMVEVEKEYDRLWNIHMNSEAHK